MNEIITVAFLIWAVAVLAALLMVRHRKPEVGIARLIFSGMAWFNADNFTPAATPYRRVFIAAFVAFMALVIVVAVAVLFIAR